MKAGHLEIFVRDPQASVMFYRDVLGFSVETEQADGKYIWMKKDTMEILIRPGKVKDAAACYQDANIGMVFYAPEFEKTVNQLKSRGLMFLGTDGSDRCLTFSDPDGNWFQLVDPNNH